MRLRVLLEDFSVARLPPNSPVTAPLIEALRHGEFGGVTFTRDEVSVVLEESKCAILPAGAVVERGWRAFRVVGQLDFSLVGILSSLLQPLAAAQCSVFTLSTYDTGESCMLRLHATHGPCVYACAFARRLYNGTIRGARDCFRSAEECRARV